MKKKDLKRQVVSMTTRNLDLCRTNASLRGTLCRAEDELANRTDRGHRIFVYLITKLMEAEEK